MRLMLALGTLVVATACSGGGGGGSDAEQMQAGVALAQAVPVNRLTAEEQEGGWRLLSDGTLDAWRGYRREDVPAGWSAADNAIAFTPGIASGSIITRDVFTDFELAFEWRVEERGNSGVFYKVTEAERAPYWTGPEYQILDNAGHPRRASARDLGGGELRAPWAGRRRDPSRWRLERRKDRGPRPPRRALAERGEDRRIRAVDGRVAGLGGRDKVQ